MVLDYLRSTLTDSKVPDYTIDEISKIINTREDGTLLEGVKQINEDKTFLKSIPSLEFETKYPCRFPEIENEINANRPVIAWILVSDGHRGFKHSVVITGVDTENGHVYYNDPAYGEVQEEIGRFISTWEDVDTILIKIKIGAREQRIMPEYVSNENDERREEAE